MNRNAALNRALLAAVDAEGELATQMAVGLLLIEVMAARGEKYPAIAAFELLRQRAPEEAVLDMLGDALEQDRDQQREDEQQQLDDEKSEALEQQEHVGANLRSIR